MKRFKKIYIFLFLIVIILVNYSLKITIDYNIISKTEKRITPLEYYLFYLKNHYNKKEIKVNNINDSICVLEYKEDNKFYKIKYFKNKFGSLIKQLRYNSKMDYELSSFDRIVLYNKNYVIFFEKPIIANTFIQAQVFKKWINNTYKCTYISFNRPIESEKIKSINFDEYEDYKINNNTTIIFDVGMNFFYGINEDFDFKQSFKMNNENKTDLNNAQTIYSPFFEPMGDKDFFNLIHDFN